MGGLTREEDIVPHCFSNDGSCSLFLTVDFGKGFNQTVDIFRGCINRKLPLDRCSNVGPGGGFVEVDPKSRRGPFIFEYCCNGQNFCNAMTKQNSLDKMCRWLKKEIRQSRRVRAVRRNDIRINMKSARPTPRRFSPRHRRNGKYLAIIRTFCQD